MRFLSHVHIHDVDPIASAHVVGREARERAYTHVAMGCHNWAAPADLMREIEGAYGVRCIRYAELDTMLDFPGRQHRTVQWCAYNLGDYSWFKPLSPFEDAAREVRARGGKLVLAHPENDHVVRIAAPFLDGCEVFNAIQNEWDFDENPNGERCYQYMDLSAYPHLATFYGADWHCWPWSNEHPDGGKGDPAIFTELPDDWFGRIVA